MSTMDFSPVRKALLTQGEFATLVGVSRVTANTWLKPTGKVRQPHRLIQAVVLHRVQQVQEALAVGHLPVPGWVERPEREAYISRVLAQAEQRLQERTRLATTL